MTEIEKQVRAYLAWLGYDTEDKLRELYKSISQR